MAEASGRLRMGDGTELYYRVIGDGARTVVVPLVYWNVERFASIAAPDLRFVFYDPRNRGQSVAADLATVGIGQQLDDLGAVVAHFAARGRASLVGTSLYGAIVARWAMLHPEWVDRVVMVGGMPPRGEIVRGYDPPERRRRVDAEAAKRLDEALRSGAIDARAHCAAWWPLFAPLYVGDPADAGTIAIPCDQPNEWPANLFPMLGALQASLAGYDWTVEAGRLDRPVLLVHGTNDLLVPLAAAEEWDRLLPDSRLLVLDGGGHLPWFDEPAKIFPPVGSFLRGVAEPRAGGPAA
jgi:pimeloyl-ACP methyl ester carboxylesterase